MSQGRVSFNRGQIFTTVALFRGEIVAVKKSFRKKIAVERTFMQEMKQVSKVSKGAKIRNQYNQVPHLTQDTNGKVTNSQ